MGKILVGLLAVLLALAAALVIRTFTHPWREQAQVQQSKVQVDSGLMAAHLAEVLRFRTVSQEHTDGNHRDALLALHECLETTYPAIHRVLRREVVNRYSLLYTWEGQDPSLDPVMLLAHMDVVPAEPAGWSRPPFEGAISDRFVWGRGALDMKGILVAMMESMEHLIAIAQTLA